MPRRRAAAIAATLALLPGCALEVRPPPSPAPGLEDYKASFAAAAGTRIVATATRDDLIAAVGRVRVLWLGDHHLDPVLHRRQRALLLALAGRGLHLQLALEAVATQDAYLVDFYLRDRIGMGELRRTILRRWPDSWLEAGSVDGDAYRELLQLARANGWPVHGLEPAPRADLAQRDARIAASVQAIAAAAPDRLLVVMVGQAHLLGAGDLVRRTGLPGLAIGSSLPPALAAGRRPPAPVDGFLRTDADLWFFADP